MKVRTVVISVVVSVALVLGIGYAAYYTMGGQATPVEVAPVTNVGYSPNTFTFEDSMTGTVTSQVSQNVILDSEYPVEEIYVKVGEEVTEGEPLFSYDMTLAEIELEADEIELMTLELQLTKYQKELQKYQGSSSTAFLMPVSMTLTASAAELEDQEIVMDAAVEEPGNEPAVAEQPDEDDFVQSAEQAEIIEDEGSAGSTANAPETSVEGGLSVESVESVSSGKSNEEEVYRSAVQNFEELMRMIEQFEDEDGKLEWTDTVIEALQKAVNFYQNQLTNCFEEQTLDAEGNTVTVVTYELKRNVTRVLSDDEITKLNAYVDEMKSYVAEYENETGAVTLQEEPTEEPESNSAIKPYNTGTGTISGTVEWEDNEDAYGKRPNYVIISLKIDDGDEPETETETVSNDDGWNWKFTGLSEPDDDGDTIHYTVTAQEIEGYEVTVNKGDVYEADLGEDDIVVCYTYTPENYGDLIVQFLLMAEQLDDRYPNEDSLLEAINFFQSCLAAEGAVVQDTDRGITMIERMLSYELSDGVKDYLDSDEGEAAGADADTLQQIYEKLCFEYCILVLSSSDVNPDDGEKLNFYAEISALYEYYNKLDDSLKNQINKNLVNMLEEMAEEYGISESKSDPFIKSEEEEEEGEEEEEEESYNEEETDWDDEYWDDDYWGYGDDDEYFSEDTSEIISELEENIKECELNIREAKLNVEQMQRIVDGKVVTSKMDGTVVSIGDEEGNSDDEYFVKVTNTDGLYARGVISELALDTVNVGDTVSGITEEGTSFSAVIKEVSDYPDENGSDYVYGSGNSNATYYTFYALIDDPDGVEEGYAELTLSDAFSKENQNGVWLDVYFVRTDSAGNNYVYVQGENEKLEKRYVTTGSVYSDWAIEITGGLKASDLIAFPYGDDVYEGAPTKEVGSLEALYDE